MNPIPLSVLDQSPIREGGTAADAIRETVTLAGLCEQWGYHRYWVAEHHASRGFAGCSPEVMLARLGAETSHIRIGSGGVMLPHYSPYKVAENFRLLAGMYPGRMDLGVGRAPGSSQFISSVLAYGSPVGPEYFPAKVADLQAFLHDTTPHTPGLENARAYPIVDTVPELWMLGSSEDSALLAARMGLPYSFAHFINPGIDTGIFEIYRKHFQPSEYLQKPHTLLCVSMVCADTEAEAIRLSLSRKLWFASLANQDGDRAFPSVEEAEQHIYNDREQALLDSHFRTALAGTPEQVRTKLLEMAQRFGADELMVVSITYDFQARCRSHRLLAEIWNS